VSEEEEKPPFAAALRFLTDRERRLLADHPAPLELAAYHAGEMSPEAEARLREHLALCRDCSDLLLDLAGVKKLTPPPGVPELTDEEVEEDWQAVRAKLGEGTTKEPAKVAEVVPIRPAALRPVDLEGKLLFWKRLAAAAIISMAGLSFWLLASGQPRESRDPQPSVFDQAAQTRGTSDSSNRMSILQDGEFRFYSREPYVWYKGEISEQGEVVWDTDTTSVAPMASDPELISIVYAVPGGSLKPGKYVARLYGVKEGTWDRIGTLDFEVEDR